ncbi:MAG: sulfite exporter TauE/SafE family protein [Neisseria sp.]|nr:sulfite exporter TauE/SafE family protein [Neisseria sp.]
MLPTAGFLAAVFAAAALLHGMVGIGFTLIPTAILALSMDMKEVVALTVLPMLVINLLSTLTGGPVWPILKRYTLLALMSVVGSFIGVKLLLILPSAWLQLALAFFIGWYVVSASRQTRIALPESAALTAAFGLAAGIIGGATNAMSSVLMMYLLARSSDKNEIAQAGNLCFTLAKVVQIVMLWPLLQQMQIPASLLLWPGIVAVAALFAGVWLRRYIPFRRFRQISLLILSILALMMVYKSLNSLLF